MPDFKRDKYFLNLSAFSGNRTDMTYTPIIGTLGYIISPDRAETLLVHRNARPADAHLGKYNGLGGKMRPDEDVFTCITREIKEEAGIDCEDILLRGTINWPGFGPHGEDWLGFIFRIDRFHGTPFSQNEEGALAWHPIATCISCRCGKETVIFCPWFLTPTPASSMAIFHTKTATR